MKKNIVIGVLISVVNLCHAANIDWEVINRFRVLDGIDEEKRFYDEFEKYRHSAKGPAFRNGLQRYPSLTTKPYKTFWNEKEGKYRPGYVQQPKSWDIFLNSSISPAEMKKSTCKWSVDGVPLASFACKKVVAKVYAKSTVRLAILSGQTENFVEEIVVEPKDYFVASIGDSFASGEGNPEINRDRNTLVGEARYLGRPASWWDRRCHRSLISGPALAAHSIAMGNKHQSVTFVSFACSGAEIFDGLLTKYEGRETYSQLQKTKEAYGLEDDWLPNPPSEVFLPTQLDALAESMCQGEFDVTSGLCKGETRKPDLLLISIGGNDIKFGPAVADFALKRFNDNSHEKKFRELIRSQREVMRKDMLTLSEEVAKKIQPTMTMITEYPDPTKKAKNTYCDDGFFTGSTFVPRLANLAGFKITAREARMAFEEVVMGLQTDLQETEKWGWKYASGTVKASEVKGYCSPSKRWFNTFGNAEARQGMVPMVKIMKTMRGKDTPEEISLGGMPSGAMHPNVFGHLAYVDAILRKLKAGQ